jgi:hypothetical protein
MKNQSLAVPLITATQVRDGATRARYFRLCCTLLGFLVGVLSQRNDVTSHLMVYFYNNLGNIYLMCMLYAIVPTLQVMVFLSLLRATHGVDGNSDLERYFITGSIIGMCVVWVGMAPGVLETGLLVGISAASVFIFHILLCVFEVDTADEEKEATDMESEYRLVIV